MPFPGSAGSDDNGGDDVPVNKKPAAKGGSKKPAKNDKKKPGNDKVAANKTKQKPGKAMKKHTAVVAKKNK